MSPRKRIAVACTFIASSLVVAALAIDWASTVPLDADTRRGPVWFVVGLGLVTCAGLTLMAVKGIRQARREIRDERD